MYVEKLYLLQKYIELLKSDKYYVNNPADTHEKVSA